MIGFVTTSAIHRTFVREDGSGKAAGIAPAKASLGPIGGYAVRLANDAGPLYVAEGVETGLSLLCGMVPGPCSIWAALSTSGMRGLELPKTPGQLVIAVDADEPGRTAGHALATRAHGLGWEVSIMDPDPGRNSGLDWNDILTGKGVAA
jgi:hypothetical protein